MFRIPQWGDSDEISWPEGLDHSAAIDITPSEGSSGGGGIGGVTNCSLTPAGYVIFECGLIIQWFSGAFYQNQNSDSEFMQYAYSITLPIAFSNTDYKVAGCSYDNGTGYIRSKTAFSTYYWSHPNMNITLCSFIAIGW
jgi:hypothetical protein